jgi:hypothetical protein
MAGYSKGWISTVGLSICPLRYVRLGYHANNQSNSIPHAMSDFDIVLSWC